MEHEATRAAGYFHPYRPLLQADFQLHFQAQWYYLLRNMANGARTAQELVGPAEVQRLQVVVQQRAQNEAKAHKRELEMIMGRIDEGKSSPRLHS